MKVRCHASAPKHCNIGPDSCAPYSALPEVTAVTTFRRLVAYSLHDAEFATLRASVARRETELALARERREPPESVADIASELEFNRVADPTVLRLQTRPSVTEELVPKELWKMLDNVTISNKLVVQMLGGVEGGCKAQRCGVAGGS